MSRSTVRFGLFLGLLLVIGLGLALRWSAAKPAESLGPPRPGERRLNPRDGLEYAWIPPGTFQMGCVPDARWSCDSDEKPLHEVRLAHGYWIGTTVVPVEKYRRPGVAMPKSPWYNPEWADGRLPMVQAHWEDARAFCRWSGGRLPTEAEWERAARAAPPGAKYPWGNEPPSGAAKAPNGAGRGPSPRPLHVASFPANSYGLFDMVGNVLEYCEDSYHDSYVGAPSNGSAWITAGEPKRVARGRSWLSFYGGSWLRFLADTRVSARQKVDIGVPFDAVGFRCARDASP